MARPKKILPKEILDLIEDSKVVVKEKSESIKSNHKWDVKKDDPIPYFQADLSYEATGYIPINETSGLDFDPDWFTESRQTYLRTGYYTEYPYGSKAFNDYWRELYRRCKYGLTVNGYTVTGDHYFFLNFYQLKDLVNVTEAGGGRKTIFPLFLEGQYEWFHYLKLARILKMNALMLKARSLK